jgi:hypothetical protein
MPQPAAQILRITWSVVIDERAGNCVVIGCDERQRDYRFVIPLVAARGLADTIDREIAARPHLFPLSVTRPLF